MQSMLASAVLFQPLSLPSTVPLLFKPSLPPSSTSPLDSTACKKGIDYHSVMSNQTRMGASKFTEDEINDLVSRLQGLLPQLNQRTHSRLSASQILKETCSHIKRLQEEVDGLCERLSRLMDSMDITHADIEETVRGLLQQ